jgi:hypothetical protein
VTESSRNRHILPASADNPVDKAATRAAEASGADAASKDAPADLVDLMTCPSSSICQAMPRDSRSGARQLGQRCAGRRLRARLMTLSMTLNRVWTGASEHESGEKAGGC